MDTTSLADMAPAHIERARAAAHGRNAQTVHGGHDRVLRQTVIALRAGETSHEYRSSREATLLTVGLVLGARESVAMSIGAGPTYSLQEDWE